MRFVLKNTRLATKKTQQEVAALVEISPRMYRHIEAGTREGKSRMWDILEDLFHKPQRELRENITTQSNFTTSEKEEGKKE